MSAEADTATAKENKEENKPVDDRVEMVKSATDLVRIFSEIIHPFMNIFGEQIARIGELSEIERSTYEASMRFLIKEFNRGYRG